MNMIDPAFVAKLLPAPNAHCPICGRAFYARQNRRGGWNKSMDEQCAASCKPMLKALQALEKSGRDKDGHCRNPLERVLEQMERDGRLGSPEAGAALAGIASRLWRVANGVNAAKRRQLSHQIPTQKSRSGWRGARTAKATAKSAAAAAKLREKFASDPETLALLADL